MTSEDSSPEASSNRRKLWIIGAVAVVIVVVLVLVGVATGWGSGSNGSSESPRPSSTTGGSATETSSPSDSESESGDADPDPTAPADPDAPRATAPAVPLDQAAEPADGVRVSLASIAAITGEVSVPGEIAGPALEITVNVENASANEALTDTLIVNVYYGPERTPANILVRPRQDLPISIAAGETAQGMYAFSVPEDARGQIVVEVDLAVDLPVVLFEGAVS